MCAKNHSSSCILDHSALNKAPMKGIPLVVKTAIKEKGLYARLVHTNSSSNLLIFWPDF